MAFVYRSENRCTYIPKTEQVGPQERFSKSVPKNNLPGPMDYADGMYPNWNKRTFNIIFAEI